LTPERWAQIRQIFEGALERPEQDRAAYLRVVCAGDDPLRQEVDTLLASHHGSGTFLEQPAADLSRALFSSGSLPTATHSYPFALDTDEYQPGFRAGPYQLQKPIGRGGMGSVWLANRYDHEFDHQVAVKLVKRGMDTQEILRRFRLERQLLAGLEHPNIARLIDGGSTAEGLPYLAMEYVEGARIDRYCEDHQLSITGRLKLFLQVCAAVQYAHSNLVVHRDIKASNILVTAAGTPKLLDFGIAKLLHHEFSTLDAAETRPEFRPMTLDYASPEQVRGENITTATDVYSLGVLLYKLLTGKLPYGVDSHNRAALHQAICNTEAIKPSAVILTDERAAIPQPTQKIEVGAETRLKARKRLKKKLAGDLDTIILKALRKEPLKRFLSVEQFAEDVRRYLEGRPVAARGDAWGYRAGKFVRRHAAAAAAATLLVLALAAGATVSARVARDAGRQLQATRASLKTAGEVASRQHEELMNARFQLGAMQAAAGDSASALASYRAALDAARVYSRAYPASPEGYLAVAGAAARAADLAPAEAFDLYREALAQFDALAARSYVFGPQELREQFAVSRRLGLAQFARQDYLAALATFSRALPIAERLKDPRLIAAASFCIAETLAHNNAADASVGRFRKAFETWREVSGAKLTVRDPSPSGYEAAIAALAEAAPPDLRQQIQADLAAFGYRP
jgi:serine/threonine protein kinase